MKRKWLSAPHFANILAKQAREKAAQQEILRARSREKSERRRGQEVERIDTAERGENDTSEDVKERARLRQSAAARRRNREQLGKCVRPRQGTTSLADLNALLGPLK